MRRARFSVRLRLALGVGALFAATLTAAAVLSLYGLESALVDDVREADEATLRELAQQIEDGNAPAGLDALAFRSGALLRVVDADGRVIATSPGFDLLLADGAVNFTRELAPGESPAEIALTPEFYSSRLPDGWLLTSVTHESAGGELILAAASPLDQARRTIAAVRLAMWLAIPALTIMISIATWFVADRALRPMRSLVDRVRTIDSNSLHERLAEPDTGDEIRELALTLNGMLARLDDASRRERDFIADASHELRNPVASIQAQLELAERYPSRADDSDLHARLTAEAARLDSLTRDLLMLAHAEDGAVLRDDEVDLDDVVLAEVRRLEDRRFHTTGVHAVRIRGSRREIERVVRNLLENAGRYANTAVHVSTSITNGLALLTVEDDGPGIPQDQREHVFLRFGRVDAGRGRDSGGAGLGLALVRSIVERHGGTATVESAENRSGEGARFEVRLPAIVESP